MGVSRAQRERVALRQQAVLDAYAMYGTIAKACEVAGIPRSEHYRWLKVNATRRVLRRPRNNPFRRWRPRLAAGHWSGRRNRSSTKAIRSGMFPFSATLS